MQDGTATAATDLVEDGFATSAARTLVTEFLTYVRAAFEQTTTLPSANMFGFKAFIDWPRCGMQRPLLALGTLTFRSLALASAASLIASMTATIQRHSAHTHALGRLGLALVADRLRRCATTSALNDDVLLAIAAGSSMADLLAWMTAWKCLSARLCTAGNVVLACLSGLI